MEITLLIVGAILGVLFEVLLKDKIENLLIKLNLSKHVDRKRNLSGKWFSLYWYYNSNKNEVVHKDILNIKQTKNAFSGQNEGDRNNYMLKGELLSNGWLSGTWETVLESADYKGVFLIHFAHNGVSVTGKWLGYDKLGIIVRHGYWVWTRHEEVIEKIKNDLLKKEKQFSYIKA